MILQKQWISPLKYFILYQRRLVQENTMNIILIFLFLFPKISRSVINILGFIFFEKNRLSHLTFYEKLLNGCPCKIEKHTRILSQCEYDIISVLEYLNLKIFAEKNPTLFESLFFASSISCCYKSSSKNVVQVFFPPNSFTAFQKQISLKFVFCYFVLMIVISIEIHQNYVSINQLWITNIFLNC